MKCVQRLLETVGERGGGKSTVPPKRALDLQRGDKFTSEELTTEQVALWNLEIVTVNTPSKTK